MDKDLKRTCTAIIPPTKPFVWWRSRCRWDFLKLSNRETTTATGMRTPPNESLKFRHARHVSVFFMSTGSSRTTRKTRIGRCKGVGGKSLNLVRERGGEGGVKILQPIWCHTTRLHTPCHCYNTNPEGNAFRAVSGARHQERATPIPSLSRHFYRLVYF